MDYFWIGLNTTIKTHLSTRLFTSFTPLQNSINPIEIYLTVGNTDLLPKAKNMPTGKQKIKQKKETIKVNDKPPQAPVSKNLLHF